MSSRALLLFLLPLLVPVALFTGGPAQSEDTFPFDWGAARGAGARPAPEGIAVDSAGDVYVVDYRRDRSGAPLAGWGSRGTQAGEFRAPTGVASDRKGRIFVADTGNHPRVARLLPWPTAVRRHGRVLRVPAGIAVKKTSTTALSSSSEECVPRHKVLPSAAPVHMVLTGGPS